MIKKYDLIIGKKKEFTNIHRINGFTYLQVFSEGKQVEDLIVELYYSGVFGVKQIEWKRIFTLEYEIIILVDTLGEDHK